MTGLDSVLVRLVYRATHVADVNETTSVDSGSSGEPDHVFFHATSVQEAAMGGKPSKGTKADKRLSTNKPRPTMPKKAS